MHDFYDPDDDEADPDDMLFRAYDDGCFDDDASMMLDRADAELLREQDRIDRIEHATSGYWRRRREHRPRGGRQSKYVRGWRLHPRRYRGRHGDRRQAAREFPEAATRAKRARLLRDPERLPF